MPLEIYSQFSNSGNEGPYYSYAYKNSENGVILEIITSTLGSEFTQEKKITNREAKQIIDFGKGYASIDNNIYFKGVSYNQINPDGFEIIKDGRSYTFARNKNEIFFLGNGGEGIWQIEGADRNTFMPIHKGLSKDRLYVYHNEKVLCGADPETFTVSTNQNKNSPTYYQDKDKLYHFEKDYRTGTESFTLPIIGKEILFDEITGEPTIDGCTYVKGGINNLLSDENCTDFSGIDFDTCNNISPDLSIKNAEGDKKKTNLHTKNEQSNKNKIYASGILIFILLILIKLFYRKKKKSST